MPSTQLTLTTSTPVNFTLPGPATRVCITQMSAPGTLYVTTDGSLPGIPAQGTTNPPWLFTQAGLTGDQLSVPCPLYGDHMVAPTLRFVSSGSPVIQLDW